MRSIKCQRPQVHDKAHPEILLMQTRNRLAPFVLAQQIFWLVMKIPSCKSQPSSMRISAVSSGLTNILRPCAIVLKLCAVDRRKRHLSMIHCAPALVQTRHGALHQAVHFARVARRLDLDSWAYRPSSIGVRIWSRDSKAS